MKYHSCCINEIQGTIIFKMTYNDRLHHKVLYLGSSLCIDFTHTFATLAMSAVIESCSTTTSPTDKTSSANFEIPSFVKGLFTCTNSSDSLQIFVTRQRPRKSTVIT